MYAQAYGGQAPSFFHREVYNLIMEAREILTKFKNNEISLEEAFEMLDEITGRLEEEGISLEESFRAYKRGMDLLKICNDKIDQVEKKVLVLNEEGGLDEF